MSHGRCVLQFWSDERNLVRTVIDIRRTIDLPARDDARMGAPKPQALELVPSSDRRTPTTRDLARRTYQRTLERAMGRAFLRMKDRRIALGHGPRTFSFGPSYVRGKLLKGTTAEAVIGVSQEESAATVDGILTLGVLWLDYCRAHSEGRRHFGGLKVVVPAGQMAHNRGTHGMAESRRSRISALHPRRAQ